MSTLVQALGDPFSWRAAPPSVFQGISNLFGRKLGGRRTPDMILRHPVAGDILVRRSAHFWTAWSPDRKRQVAEFFRTEGSTDLQGFHMDLDRCYGPEARARLDTMILRVRISCAQRGLYGLQRLDEGRGGFYLVLKIRMDALTPDPVVEPGLRPDMDMCARILIPSPDGLSLSQLKSITVMVPNTHHGMMEMLLEAAARGVHLG